MNLQQLIIQISRDEDKKSFEQLFFYFYPQLFRLAYTYLRQTEEAEEAVSDVFVKLWEQRAKLDEIRNLEIYLRIAVKNHSLNRMGKLRKISYGDMEEVIHSQATDSENPEE